MAVIAGRRAMLASGIVLAVSGCSDPTVPTPATAPVAQAEATRHDIRLSAAAESATVASGDIIEVTATLERLGPDPQELTGSGSGLVLFSVTRLEDGLTSGPPGSRLDCKPHVLSRDEPMTGAVHEVGWLLP